MPKIIAQGAEAIIVLDKDKIIKDRIAKSYRIKQIDDKLRKSRTRRETKIIEKLSAIGIPGPELIDSDDKNMRIVMGNINGNKLRDVLENLDYAVLCKKLGELVAELHNNNIIHGDLTTSNMILEQGKICFIDFGLSYFSTKIEDKAVDLHLLRQALESKHYRVWEKCFKAVLKGYKKAKQHKEILSRLEKVEQRGRNKEKK